MNRVNKLAALQTAGWLISFTLFTVYLRQRLWTYEWAYILGISLSAFLSFALVIYTYIYYLHPKLSRKVHPILFAGSVTVFFFLVVSVRMLLEREVVANLSVKGNFFYFGKAHFYYNVISVFIALVIAIMLKIAMDSLLAEKRQETLKRQQLETEMQLLKSQLQPHFIFNSLNNIYYEVYKESPGAAGLIQKLSDLMRYLISESSKNRIPVETEIRFLKNYIEFENMRLRYEVPVEIREDISNKCEIPPLIVLPFIENVFKHGVNKLSHNNIIQILLHCGEGFFEYKVVNSLSPEAPQPGTAIGLNNLRERLKLLYGNSFELNTERNETHFYAYLKVPL